MVYRGIFTGWWELGVLVSPNWWGKTPCGEWTETAKDSSPPIGAEVRIRR